MEVRYLLQETLREQPGCHVQYIQQVHLFPPDLLPCKQLLAEFKAFLQAFVVIAVDRRDDTGSAMRVSADIPCSFFARFLTTHGCAM